METINARGGADRDPAYGARDHSVMPATLFGVHIEHDDHAGTKVSDQIDDAVAHRSLAEVYRNQVADADFMGGEAVLYIGPDIEMRQIAPWDRDVCAKIVVQLSGRRGKLTLAKIGGTATAGFVAVPGNWVTHTLLRVSPVVDGGQPGAVVTSSTHKSFGTLCVMTNMWP